MKNQAKTLVTELKQSSSVKAKVALALLSGKALTFPQLCARAKGKPVTVRTALSDLKSRKYGVGQPLRIVRDNDRYCIRSGKK